jgi:hypothetical protein
MVSYNYNRNRYRQPSMFTQMRQTQEVLGETQQKLSDALTQVKALESEVARLERELANRG